MVYYILKYDYSSYIRGAQAQRKIGIVGTKYLEKAAMIRNERIWREDRSNIGYGFRNRKK